MEQEYKKDTPEPLRVNKNDLEILNSPQRNIGKPDLQYTNIPKFGYNVLNQRGIIECEIISSEDLLFNPEEDLIKYSSDTEDNIYDSGNPDLPSPKNPVEQMPPANEQSKHDSDNLNSLNTNQDNIISMFIDTFESTDGILIDEGFFVTLDGTKIRKVGLWDNYIIGVTSKALENKQKSPLNPVILCGKAVVKDDGTCVPNGFCIPNSTGIATAWQYGYRVMERKGPGEVLILIK